MTTIIKDETLAAIGNAIREKTGKTNKLTPAEMATEIAGITTGGDTLNDYLAGTLKAFKNDEVTSIKYHFFQGKENLEAVSCKSATTVEDGGFDGCSSLKKVALPSLTTIKDFAFNNCYSLTSEPFGNFEHIKHVGSYAIAYCKKFSLTKMLGAVTIYPNAFSGDILLRKLFIKGEGTKLLTVAFNGCENLTDVYTDAAEKPADWADNAFLATTTIHYGVTEAEFDEILAAGGAE